MTGSCGCFRHGVLTHGRWSDSLVRREGQDCDGTLVDQAPIRSQPTWPARHYGAARVADTSMQRHEVGHIMGQTTQGSDHAKHLRTGLLRRRNQPGVSGVGRAGWSLSSHPVSPPVVSGGPVIELPRFPGDSRVPPTAPGTAQQDSSKTSISTMSWSGLRNRAVDRARTGLWV